MFLHCGKCIRKGFCMKRTKRFVAASLCALLLAGCGGVSKEVTSTCTAEMPGAGLVMSAVIKAPAEDAEISSIDFKFEMPFAAIREAAGDAAANLSDSEVKSIVESQEETYISTITTLLGVDAADIKTEVTDSALNMEISMKDFDKIRTVFDISEDQKMIYKDIVSGAESNGFACE